MISHYTFEYEITNNIMTKLRTKTRRSDDFFIFKEVLILTLLIIGNIREQLQEHEVNGISPRQSNLFSNELSLQNMVLEDKVRNCNSNNTESELVHYFSERSKHAAYTGM